MPTGDPLHDPAPMTTPASLLRSPDPASGPPTRRGLALGRHALAFVPMLLVVALAIGLMWQVRNDSAMHFDQVVAYSVFLLTAAAGPIGLALLQHRESVQQGGADELPHRLLSPLVVCTAISLLVAAAGVATYHVGSGIITRGVDRRLQAVATLKASLVKSFLDDVRDGIRLSIESPAFFHALDDWRRAGGAEKEAARQRLVDYLWRLSQTEHYIEIGLRDPADGALLLTTTGDEDTPDVRRQAIEAAAAATPLIEDFHVDSDHDRPGQFYLGCFGAVSPPGGAARVVIHVGIDPRRELFPLIEQWPGTSPTAEVLLMRSDGNVMTVLNDSPQRHDGQAIRGAPIADPHYVATALTRDGAGTLRGNDDTGEPVFAHAVGVPGTTWLVLAKVDEAEAFAELNRVAVLAASIVGVLWLLGGWWWVEHRRRQHADRQRVLERTAHAQRIAELSRRVVSAQEEERRRWSSELHDRTGANLAAINLNLKAIARLIPQPDAEDAELLDETGALLGDTVASIREFCSTLRPAALDYAGLVPALQTAVAQFRRRTGIEAVFEHGGFDGRCSDDVESALFRIAQEALLNCAKHARATRVGVTLMGNPDRVRLAIEDDGVGFDPGTLGQRADGVGQGLLNMSERAAFVGARCEVRAEPGRGTHVTIEWHAATPAATA